MNEVTTDDPVRHLGIIVDDLEALAEATTHNANEKIAAPAKRGISVGLLLHLERKQSS